MPHFPKCLLIAVGCAAFLTSCTAPPPDMAMPGHAVKKAASDRLTAVVVTARSSLAGWNGSRFSIANAPGDADGGSATPVSADGYFVTADHVLNLAPNHRVFVTYRNGGNIVTGRARIVWRSSASDLAVLHVPFATPYFYKWSPPEKWQPVGTPVVHGGIATGPSTPVGKLSSELAPEGGFTGDRRFKIDMPLRPGDSGGPVINAKGEVVGINSAVEFLVPMETAFFIDSECIRPNVRNLDALIDRDRSTPRQRIH